MTDTEARGTSAADADAPDADATATADEPRTPVPDLQGILRRLVDFWTGEGCLLLPSCDFEIPSGTLHPSTFFRLLTPEPWRAVYLQPVRRPLDCRLARHPYRLGRHLQLTVVLQGPPADPHVLYRRSLEAAGLELSEHDLRLVDQLWRSEPLGARGAGWRITLDGVGIGRLTYLRRVAGRDLEPPAVEVCYGLERLALRLAGARGVFELGWTDGGPDYRRLRRRDEEELGRYVFEVADAGDLRRRIEGLVTEAARCLEADLARPAYELAVKSLLGIEVLEARGELTARERETWIEGVGRMVRGAGERWLGAAAEPAPAADAVEGAAGSADSKEAEEPPVAETGESTEKGKAGKRKAKKGRKARRPKKKAADADAEPGEGSDGG